MKTKLLGLHIHIQRLDQASDGRVSTDIAGQSLRVPSYCSNR